MSDAALRALNCEQSINAELPTLAQRRIGTVYLRKYAHMAKEDPAFIAAAVYRLMMLAKIKPDAPELNWLWREAAHVE